LPNRFRQATAAPALPPTTTALGRVGEVALGGTLGDRLEAWEGRRKQRRFGSGDHSARFTDDVCEGHFGRARQRVLGEFARRCGLLGIALPSPGAPAESGEQGGSPAATFIDGYDGYDGYEQGGVAAGDK
jgi:hypothetical protein